MKKRVLLNLMQVLTIVSCNSALSDGALYPIDTTLAVVYSPEGNDVITQSSIDRPAIDGSMRTLQDLVEEARFFAEAKKYGMSPGPDQIETHLNYIQQSNNLTRKQIEELFDASGYTMAEGKEQLGRMLGVNTLIDAKVRSRLLIPQREIQAYYDEHPEYTDPAYYVQRGMMPFAKNMSASEQRKKMEKMIKSGKEVPRVEWTEPFWVQDAELSDEKKFLADMKTGEIRISGELFNGFELFKMRDRKERRLRTLEERYTSIVEELRRPRYQKIFSEFQQSIEATIPVTYFN